MNASYSAQLLVVRNVKRKDNSTIIPSSLSSISLVMHFVLFDEPLVKTNHFVHDSDIADTIMIKYAKT